MEVGECTKTSHLSSQPNSSLFVSRKHLHNSFSTNFDVFLFFESMATATSSANLIFKKPSSFSINRNHKITTSFKIRASSSNNDNGGDEKKGVINNSKYVVPLDKANSGIGRPLAEILRDLNKKVPHNIINHDDNTIPWYHANRMLSFYAPGWCGEIRKVIYTDNGKVTVLYRVTIRGSDGEAHRESTGTISLEDVKYKDPVAAAEELAFCRACARFGFGLYLYHEDETN